MEGGWRGLLTVLTTNLLFTFSRICFSLSAMASPFRFLIRFFSSFLQAYILPVARTWQAHTWNQGKRYGDVVHLVGHKLGVRTQVQFPAPTWSHQRKPKSKTKETKTKEQKQ